MNHVSPRSLKLLEDIINGAESEYGDVYVEQTTHGQPDVSRKERNMNEEESQDFHETLNFFEKLERENGIVNGHVQNGGQVNGHEENGGHNDSLQGIAEESSEETYTVTEISDTTLETTTFDDTTSSSTNQKQKCLNKKTLFTKRDINNHNNRRTKTSSVREGSTDRDSLSDLTETMSDSGHVGRRQRKLKKREQMMAFRPIAIEPLESAEERLQRKYEELRNLISGQFSERTSALNENHMKQMELLRQQYAIASHGLPPTGMSRRTQNGYHQHHVGNKENHQQEGTEDEAYTTIRTLQTTKAGQRRSRTRSARTRPLSATRQNQSRSTSRERRDVTPDDKRRQNSKERSTNKGKRGSKSRSRSNSRSRSSSSSPRRMYLPTETHLKNTDNEFVKEWLKKKDKECRRKKAEERRRKKLERKEKIERQIEKEEKFKDSHKVVQDWMKQKQKEAYRKQRDERQLQKEEAAKKAHERAKKLAAIHGWKVGQPVSVPAPVQPEKSKLRVSRPGTTVEEMQAREEEILQKNMENDNVFREGTQEIDKQPDQDAPQPPVTRYVYRRPVLGKVRLRMKQQAPEPAKSPKRKPVEKSLSKEEIERRQRVSYDEWLQQKRREDAEKKKEQQKQEQLAKSQPEFERPVPELQQNGQGNVLQGRAISPGGLGPRSPQRSRVISKEEQDRIREKARQKKYVSRSIEDEVNTYFDVRSETPEEAIDRVAKNVVKYVISSLSDEETDGDPYAQEGDLFVEDEDEAEHEGLANLSISGSKASLKNRTRPSSASHISVPAPQTSKSPRRPVSAQQMPTSPTRETRGRLPFSPDAPAHIQRVQKKLFSDRLWINPEDERPEPQGSDFFEHNVALESRHHRLHGTSNGTLSADDEGFASNMTPGQEPSSESQASSKKRVSFCEETTIFDEEDASDIEEDLEDWNEAANDDIEDLEKARDLLEDILPNNAAQQGIFITGNNIS